MTVLVVENREVKIKSKLDYNLDELKIILLALKKLRKFVKTYVKTGNVLFTLYKKNITFFPMVALCGNLEEILEQMDAPKQIDPYTVIYHFCEDWVHYTGNQNHPVPTNQKQGTWQGDNLRLRIELLHHVIANVIDLIAKQDTDYNRYTKEDV